MDYFNEEDEIIEEVNIINLNEVYICLQFYSLFNN